LKTNRTNDNIMSNVVIKKKVNVRIKGHTFEREWVKILKTLGFKDACTSRLCNRDADNKGIDIVNVPFAVQLKCGYENGLNYKKELEYMKTDLPKILIHKQKKNEGYVCIPYKDFLPFLQSIQNVANKQHTTKTATDK